MFSPTTLRLLDQRLAPLATGPGIQCIYDQPELSLELEPVAWRRFWKSSALMGAVPAIVLGVHPSYGPVLLVAAALVMAWRMAQLKANTLSAEQAVSGLLGAYLLWMVSSLALQGLATLAADIDLLGFVLRWLYRLWVTFGVLHMIGAQTLDDMFSGYCRRLPGLPRVVIEDTALAERRAHLCDLVEHLPARDLFDADGAQVKDAWAKRDVELLEALYHLGGNRTWCGWREGLDLFNMAVLEIDVARGHLRHVLLDAADLLEARGLKPDRAALESSNQLAGSMTPPTLQMPSLMQRQMGRGALNVVGSAVSGQVPWQVGALAVGVAAMAHFAQQSAALRRLADHEGQLRYQVTVARGDLALLATLIQTRLIPQFDQLVETAAQLRARVARPIAGWDDAVVLAKAVQDGAGLLTTTGGN